MNTSREEQMGHAVQTECSAVRSSSNERGVMRRAIVAFSLMLFAALFLPLPSDAQDSSSSSSETTQGKNVGDYNVQQSIELGVRWNDVSGDMDNYDTFIDLRSGPRLLDYTLDMRSLDHHGIFFDDLNFSNFGYGGDPNDVSRLHMDKNKWYDFTAMFRRDENFWDYNLLANPLNPASLNPAGSLTTGCYVGPTTATYPQGEPAFCSSPAIAESNSPHMLNLVRRMQDYDLVLFPQSRVRVRLGFSHDRDEGPGFFTTDSGTIPDFPESYSYTMNAYRAGVDYQVAPRTTISFDQLLNYFKQDNVVAVNPTATPQQYQFQAANGVPVDLGIVWSTQTPAEALPCATPIANAATTPETASSICNGFVSASQVGRPRDFMPTEQFHFQSNYFKSFEMTGSFAYSSSDDTIPDFNQTIIGWTTRTSSPGSSTAGPADAKRDQMDASWSGVYALTNKLSIKDFFHYNGWRIPGIWDSEIGSFFDAPGATGLGAPIGDFVAADCNAADNYNGPSCPQHTASSSADIAYSDYANFYKEYTKSNTLELEYDFASRFGADIGYLYENRSIESSMLSYPTESIYFPGGATASAANYYLAARGSCTLVGGVLPSDCAPNADGSITYSAPANTTPPAVIPLTINENALLLGFRARPIDSLRITTEFVFGYNDAAYTRMDPRQVESYKIHATYTPKPWASLDGSIDINENRDNVYTVNALEHDRQYSFTAMLTPKPNIAFDFGFNYWNVFMDADICFNYSITAANPAPPPSTITVGAAPPGVATFACNIPTASVGAAGLETDSNYASSDYFPHADVMWKPVKRVTATLGYGGSFVRGSATFLNPLSPSGTLDYNYQMPYGSLLIDLGKGVSYKTAWNYYGFNETGVTSPFGLQPLPLEDFDGSNVTFSVVYAF
jgi:hypothetical protein